MAGRLAARRPECVPDNCGPTRAMRQYASSGSREDFIVVYRCLDPMLRRFARRQMRDQPAEVGDLLQETYKRMMIHRGQFGARSCVIAWAFGIARNRARDMGESTSRFTLIEGDDLIACAGLALPPDGTYSAREVNALLFRELEQMHKQHVKAFRLIRVEGLTHAAAAGTLQVPVNTVSTWLQRALADLRRALEQFLGGRN